MNLLTLPGKLVGRPDLRNALAIDHGCLPLLAEMERVGTVIDADGLNTLAAEMLVEMRELEGKIKAHIPTDKLREFLRRKGTGPVSKEDLDSTSADDTPEDPEEDELQNADVLSGFNINSSEKVGWLLFDILGLGKGVSLKRTADGKRISTGKKQLEQLKQEHEIISLLLNYRELAKLRTTYAYKLPRIAVTHPKGLCPVCGYWHKETTKRIHTQFPTTRTETGRPACSAAWTQVTTKRGVLSISDVRIGDYVWTHRLRWRPVTATWIKGTASMFDVTFSNGDVLTCTADHKLLVYCHEHIKALDSRSEECQDCSESIQIGGVPDFAGDSESLWNDLSHSPLDLQKPYTRSGVQSPERDSVLTLETSREEPNVRQNRKQAPQLERSCGRWVRVSDLLTQWQASICAPHNHGALVGVGRVTRDIRCPSYRWEQEKQQPGQLSGSNQGRTQDDTLSTNSRLQDISITKITYSGCFEVYDITVDEDESYQTYDVFSHNSRNPNLQNIPARTKRGKLIRSKFIPAHGRKWVSVDESQIELRSLAHCANEAVMISIYEQDGDIHKETARRAFDLPSIEAVDDDMHRAPSKTVNFGVIYGMSAVGLYAQLIFMFNAAGKPIPNWLTVEWCEEFIVKWFGVYPGVRSYMSKLIHRLHKYGMVWTQFGHVRQIEGVWSAHNHIVSECERQAGNMPIQGFAASLMKLWCYLIAPPGGGGYLEQWRRMGDVDPLLTVHDELNFDADPHIAEEVKDNLISMVEFIGEMLGMRCPIKADGKVMDYWRK